MNNVIYIPAQFKPIGENLSVKVPTGEKKKGLFGGEKDVMRSETRFEQTGWSDCLVDGERLATEVAQAIANLNASGYELVSITPVTSGNYAYQFKSEGITSSKRIFSETEKVSGGGSYGYGYGYSYTEGVIIVGRKIPGHHPG